jgi:broad specificity phosphatase PhoE
MQRARVAPSAIYSSDQIRAVETALIVRAALGEIPLLLDARLREMDQGVWEGMLYSQIEAEYGEPFRRFRIAPFEVTPPGGESMAEMVRRTFAALDSIAARHPQGTVLVVSHEFPVAAAACAGAGFPITRLLETTPGNCHWLTVRWPLAASSRLSAVQPSRHWFES